MRVFFFSIFFLLYCLSEAQESAHREVVYTHTISIPVSWDVHIDADSSGYITNKTDTLFFRRYMVVMPLMMEMIYYTGVENDLHADSINAEAKRYNDSIRTIDPRVGTHYDRLEHGNNAGMKSSAQ